MTNISAEVICPAVTKLPGEVKVCVTKAALLTSFDIVPPLTAKGSVWFTRFHTLLAYTSS